MDMRKAQIAYDNQEPDLVDTDQLITARIDLITEACKAGDLLPDGGPAHPAAEHVFDHMDFATIYSIIRGAQTMGDEELGKFVKKQVQDGIVAAAEYDIERGIE